MTVLVSSFILSLVFNDITCSPKPAFYVDNGLDQTIIDREMTKIEQRQVEFEILNLLDLSDTPKKVKKSVARAAPKFLLDIYKTLLENENEGYPRRKRHAELNLSGGEQNAIDESDVIMTFEAIDDRVSSVRHEKGKRFWFDVTEIPTAENVVGAELRIFQKGTKSGKNAHNVYIVTVYEVLNILGERELELLTAVNTTGNFNGWLGLNLTKSLSKWLEFPNSNKGLYLSVQLSKKPAHEIELEDIGLMTTKRGDEMQPFMVTFLKSPNRIKVEGQILDISPRRRNKRSDYTTVMQRNVFRNCRMHNLYISFKDLGWMDWILAPEGYSPYYCDGECNFPLNAHTNATNHALIQSLLHLLKPQVFPKPRCAPTKLKMFPIVHYKGDTNVVVFKKFKDMIVHSCGCH